MSARQAAALASVSTCEAEIGRGDLLYVPAWWLHAFPHRGDFNANVNFWWKPRAPADNAVARRQAALDAASA